MPTAQRPHMPDYGVTDDAEGLLGWDWAASRLERCRNYWLAAASADGRPHAMPVWGLWCVEPDRFVFSCGPQARKASNLRANPRAVVTTDDTVEVVSVEGTVVPCSLADAPELVEGFVAKYEPDLSRRPALAAFLSETTGFELRPERAFGIIERPDEFGRRATRWVW